MSTVAFLCESCGRKGEKATGKVVSLLFCSAWQVVLGPGVGNCSIELLTGRAEGPWRLLTPQPLIQAQGRQVAPAGPWAAGLSWDQASGLHHLALWNSLQRLTTISEAPSGLSYWFSWSCVLSWFLKASPGVWVSKEFFRRWRTELGRVSPPTPSSLFSAPLFFFSVRNVLGPVPPSTPRWRRAC